MRACVTGVPVRDCNPVDLWNYIYKMIDVKSGHEGNKRVLSENRG